MKRVDHFACTHNLESLIIILTHPIRMFHTHHSIPFTVNFQEWLAFVPLATTIILTYSVQ